jgi:hypothetical protein
MRIRCHWYRMNENRRFHSRISLRFRSKIQKGFSPWIRGPRAFLMGKKESRKSLDTAHLKWNTVHAVKGIVSRGGMFFWCHSIDLKFLHIRSVFVFCFTNYVFVSNFSIFKSRRSELTLWVELAFSPSRDSEARYSTIGFYIGNELIIDPDSSKIPSTGLPRTGTVFIFKIFPPKQYLQEPRSGIIVRGFNRSSENSTRNRNFKSKQTLSVRGINFRSIDYHQKTYTSKSLETIPLKRVSLWEVF